MAEFKKCRNKRCGIILDAADRSYTDGRDPLALHPHCPECGEDRWDDVEHICNDCLRAEAAKDDDYCASCRDAMDERDYEADLDAIELAAGERQGRELMDVIVGIARGETV